MTVAELIGLLASQDQTARVLMFDEARNGMVSTIEVNCVLSMNAPSPVVIMQHDHEEADRLVDLQPDEQLGTEESAAFVSALLDPPEPNDALVRAAETFKISDGTVQIAAWAWLRAFPGYEEGKGVPPTQRELDAIRAAVVAALQSQAPPSPTPDSSTLQSKGG